MYLDDAQATYQAGAEFAQHVKLGDIIFLEGPLGAGKTTFTQGFLNALGVEENVLSPTYSLVETYHIDDGIIHHFDLYRLKSAEELRFLGIEEYFDLQTIVLIEWAEKGMPILPEPNWWVSLEYDGEGRKVSLSRAVK